MFSVLLKEKNMAKSIFEYTVIVTFDLSYAQRSDYRSINSFLNEKRFKPLSERSNNMPSNTYLGSVNIEIDAAGKEPTWAELKAGAAKATKSVYSSISNAMKNSGINITLFVQASPSSGTSSLCTRS